MKIFGGFYFLGFIGTMMFYIQQATTFWMGVIGVVRAMVWPAMIVYKVLELLYR